MKILEKLSIRKRLILISIITGAIFLITLPLLNGLHLKNKVFEEKKQLLINTTELTVNILELYSKKVAAGELSLSDAQKQALIHIDSFRYLDKKGYFFIYDYDGVCISNPVKPDFNGKNRINTTDPKGNKYIKSIIDIAKTDGQGFVDYYFSKPGVDKNLVFPKIAYTKGFDDWKWAISTGFYLDDFNIEALIIESIFHALIAVASILIITILFINLPISKSILEPLEKLTKLSLQLADNNLNINIPEDNNKTEIGELNRSFKKFNDNFKHLIVEVMKSIEDISASSQEMSASADQTANGSQQTAISTSQLAQGTQEISRNVEQGAATIGQMNKVIQGISKEALEISELGNITEKDANQGSSDVQKAVGKIDSIKNVSEDISVTISKLGNLSSEIETIVDLIKNIAGQTNLLALNAAIEAARAGEHGKGFAVVADEVKKLATQSAGATDKITAMIKEIQNETSEAVNKMNKATQEVEEGVIVVNYAGKSLDNIIFQVKTANTKIQHITKEIEGVAENSDDVVKMVENISAVTEETAASAEEISSITEEQTASMEQISASSQILAKIAEELNKQVSVFKV